MKCFVSAVLGKTVYHSSILACCCSVGDEQTLRACGQVCHFVSVESSAT